MRIIQGSIIDHPSTGRMTLQIPSIAIFIGAESSAQYEEVPDEWICELRQEVPVTGKEQGYLFLTRTGWDANREQIRQAFEASGSQATWEQFEQFARRHFTEVERKTQRKLQQLQNKVDQLRRYLQNG
jgi:hypothetical protein